MREKLIDVFMHMGDHIRSLDEYGFCFDSTLAKAIEDVVEMLKNPNSNSVTSATDNNVGSKWIPVSERLPEEDEGVVLVYSGDVEPAIMSGNIFLEYDKYEGWEINNVTHWMPLPEPPKEERQWTLK